MPPSSVPRLRLHRLPPSRQSSSSSVLSRCFSTTPNVQRTGIPPESPNYITLPTPPQSEEKRWPRLKGHLPVPRKIFHPTKGHLRGAPEHVAEHVGRATQRSQAEMRGDPPNSDNQAWRRLMASSRRQNLGEGIAGLWKRKTTRETRDKARSAAALARNKYLALRKPERPDDILTRSTVRDSTAKATAVTLDPERFNKAAAAAIRTAAIEQFRAESRRDHLVDLYVASRNFIVDEAELARRVDEQFHPEHFKKIGDSMGNLSPENIWEAKGAPQTVRSMLATAKTGGIMGEESPDVRRTTNRQKVLAETLTGGKMLDS